MSQRDSGRHELESEAAAHLAVAAPEEIRRKLDGDLVQGADGDLVQRADGDLVQAEWRSGARGGRARGQRRENFVCMACEGVSYLP